MDSENKDIIFSHVKGIFMCISSQEKKSFTLKREKGKDGGEDCSHFTVYNSLLLESLTLRITCVRAPGWLNQ